MNRKGFGRKWLCHNLRHSLYISPKRLKRTTKSLS